MKQTMKAATIWLLACTAGLAGPAGPADIDAQQAAPQYERSRGSSPSAMGLQGYSVVLVVGDMQAAGAGDTVPPAARKALTDMQAFLPYKRYQLVDAAWMLCCGAVRSPISGRMRGPEERDFVYTIETQNAEDAKLTVRFMLRDETPAGTRGGLRGGGGGVGVGSGSGSGSGSGASSSATAGKSGQYVVMDAARIEYGRQLYESRKELDDAEVQMRRQRQMAEAGTASNTEVAAATRRYQLARQRVDELERVMNASNAQNAAVAAGPRGSLLDSTFSISIGETVVIGTSRLKGDQALIALLTAAGKPGPAR